MHCIDEFQEFCYLRVKKFCIQEIQGINYILIQCSKVTQLEHGVAVSVYFSGTGIGVSFCFVLLGRLEESHACCGRAPDL